MKINSLKFIVIGLFSLCAYWASGQQPDTAKENIVVRQLIKTTKTPDGDERFLGQTFEFRRMIIIVKRDGVWKIIAGQNAKLENGIK